MEIGNRDGIPVPRQKPGMWFQVELPELTRVMALTLDTRGSDLDYPRGFKVSVSTDGKKWGEPTATGQGVQPITEIELSTFEPTRFIRIEQTGTSPNKFWSIHDLNIKGLPGDADLTIKSLAQKLAEEDVSKLVADVIKKGNAKRGAQLFADPSFSCAKCHQPPGEAKRLGPDLASQRDGVSAELLVDAILRPSKDIRKGFEAIMVQTVDGLIVSGFPVNEDNETLTLREPAGGKEIKVLVDDIEARKKVKNSIMPAGLANQLADREQFLDLVAFLIEIEKGGAKKLQELLPK